MKSLLAVIAAIAVVFVLASVARADNALVPAPPASDRTWSESTLSTTPQSTTVPANGTICSAIGGASCTLILADQLMRGFADSTLYIQNAGGSNALTDVLVEAGPDGNAWAIISATPCQALAPGAMCIVNFLGHYAHLRVEARSASGTTAKVWVSGMRP